MSAGAEVKENSLASVLKVKDVREELGIDTVDNAVDSRLNRFIYVADAYL